jgi:copper chaperone CopZ
MALSLVLFSYLNSAAQDQKMKAVEFKVTGNCEMCKKTIESSLKGQPGIQSSNWNKNTKMIKVVYDPAKTTEDKIHQAIADSGYDTEKVKASDKSYKA